MSWTLFYFLDKFLWYAIVSLSCTSQINSFCHLYLWSLLRILKVDSTLSSTRSSLSSCDHCYSSFSILKSGYTTYQFSRIVGHHYNIGSTMIKAPPPAHWSTWAFTQSHGIWLAIWTYTFPSTLRDSPYHMLDYCNNTFRTDLQQSTWHGCFHSMESHTHLVYPSSNKIVNSNSQTHVFTFDYFTHMTSSIHIQCSMYSPFTNFHPIITILVNY